jgi:hypothetical protein
MTNLPNARFWAYINGSPVRLTLKPGEEISHQEGGRTDEGFDYTGTSWYYDTLCCAIVRDTTRCARDCDGRLDQRSTYRALVAHLRDGGEPCLEYTDRLSLPHWQGVRWPQWTEGRVTQRDYSAEAMGY